MIVPLYLKDLEVSVVNGVQGMSEEKWQELYLELKASLKTCKEPAHLGNKGIMNYVKWCQQTR